MSYVMLLGGILLSGISALSIAEPIPIGDMTIKTPNPVYTKDNTQLFSSSIANAYKVNAYQQKIESELALYSAAKKYYVPSASVTQHVKHKFRNPDHPLPYTEYLIDLNASMKLWSDAVGDRENAALYHLESAKHSYNAVVNDIYAIVDANLVKIELAREFLDRAEEYRRKLKQILKQLDISTTSGVLKKSDQLFADVALKKFEDSILLVQSQMLQYQARINNITPLNLYHSDYGISKHEMDLAIVIRDEYFNINRALQHNFEVRARRATLEANKASTKGYRENFTLSLATQHAISEHRLSGSYNAQNDRFYGYTYDRNGESYVGLTLSYTGLDYQSYKAQESENHRYNIKVIELDEYLHQLYVDLNTFQTQYKLAKERLTNVNHQLVLTHNVIQSLMQEMLADASNILDVFRNITTLSELEVSRLSVNCELVDLASKVKSLNAVIPNQYVIH